jgi:hypothetical protein
MKGIAVSARRVDSGFDSALYRKLDARGHFSQPDPQRQVFVAGVEENATSHDLQMATSQSKSLSIAQTGAEPNKTRTFSANTSITTTNSSAYEQKSRCHTIPACQYERCKPHINNGLQARPKKTQLRKSARCPNPRQVLAVCLGREGDPTHASLPRASSPPQVADSKFFDNNPFAIITLRRYPLPNDFRIKNFSQKYGGSGRPVQTSRPLLRPVIAGPAGQDCSPDRRVRGLFA